MIKITFMGAGSTVFARNVLGDCMCTPALRESEIALYDIDEKRLEDSRIILSAINHNVNEDRAVIKTYLGAENRKDALRDADFVVNAIQVGGYEPCTVTDFEIPKKYGVDTNVGDTRGPSGIFRYLRTVNPILEIAADIEKYCPDAVYLNYTNPMAMLCRTVQSEHPHLMTSGLCHSVQGTAMMLAKWIGAKDEEITYPCAGINHQAFYTKFLWNGKDAYPLIRKAILERPEVYNEEIVRNEMFLALGYYVTESSGHNSEYNAWFRKRPDLIEKYCTHGTGWNPGEYAFILNEYRRREHDWKDDIDKWFAEPLDLNRGHEYAASIFNAIFGDGEMFKFNGNVRNFGLIDNLPEGCCVEVPVLASRRGLEPIHVGKMPPQLAILSGTSAQIEEMAVQASLTGDRELVYQAICYDPLTAAVCSLREIRAMVDEMFEANKDWMPQFK